MVASGVLKGMVEGDIVLTAAGGNIGRLNRRNVCARDLSKALPDPPCLYRRSDITVVADRSNVFITCN